MLIFRQVLDPQSSTYTYLIGDDESHQSVLIDPVFEQVGRDAALIEELGLELLCTVDTHVHADHVTGAWLLKQRVGSQIFIAKQSGAEGADRYLEHGEHVEFGKRYLEVRATPGHTSGCVTYVLHDESRAFTGDALLIRGAGRTDFQQGDPGMLYRSVHSQIFTLPASCLLYPGHDYRGLTVTSVAEERQFNPRLGGALSENDFASYMNNLGLGHPKQMEIAVLEIAIRAFGAALFRDKYLASHALLKEPRAGDMICMDVGIDGAEKLEPQLFDQRRVAADLLEYGIDEH